MTSRATFLIFGATGGTGKHLVSLALAEGHRVRVLVRDPSRLPVSHADLDVVQGSLTDAIDYDALLKDVDYVVAMVGERAVQQERMIAEPFVKQLVPAMRRTGVRRFLYQAGGLSKPYGGSLSIVLWIIRNTIARGYDGQHRDNEAVMAYLATEAKDVEWSVHRAGIGSDGPSKGILKRSPSKFSVATHHDCARYNFHAVQDEAAVHTSDFSCYESA